MSGKKRKQPIEKHEGPDHSSPYPVSRMAPPISLADLARQVEMADQAIASHAGARLQVISDQIKKLQEQARQVLEKARADQDLHRVKCNFKRIPGKIYYLYARPDGSRYFSMLSPDDWQGAPPGSFAGGFRLEADMSWTSAEDPDRGAGFSEIMTGYLHSRDKDNR